MNDRIDTSNLDLGEMIEWLTDAGITTHWYNGDDDATPLGDIPKSSIARIIDSLYVGGLKQFRIDG